MLKWIAFGFLMLLVGQIKLGRQTLGEHSLSGMNSLLESGQEKMVKSKLYAELASVIPFIRRLEKKEPAPVLPKPVQRRSDARFSSDEFTSTERESLIRVLQ